MRPRAGLVCKLSSWHGRQAFVLENDLMRLITLTGGGHIAEFRFREGSGPSTLNPLWIPPWKTIEPLIATDDIDRGRSVAGGWLADGVQFLSSLARRCLM